MLASEQAQAIRNADSVCFDYHAGNGQIRAITHKIGLPVETTVTIPVDSTVHCYDGARGVFTCFDMVQSAQHVPEWRTVCKRIRKGSVVRLDWVRGNSSPVTTQAGLVVDYLNIVVDGDAYRVRDYVGPDHTGRMVLVR